jgi:hypothetical protein
MHSPNDSRYPHPRTPGEGPMPPIREAGLKPPLARGGAGPACRRAAWRRAPGDRFFFDRSARRRPRPPPAPRHPWTCGRPPSPSAFVKSPAKITASAPPPDARTAISAPVTGPRHRPAHKDPGSPPDGHRSGGTRNSQATGTQRPQIPYMTFRPWVWRPKPPNHR